MNETPPPYSSLEEQEQWWRDQGEGMDNSIEILTDDERICPRCGANNPCTGNDTCVACEESLDGSRRDEDLSQHSAKSQNW